jgi:DNA-binding GntR family transcriptional regulator
MAKTKLRISSPQSRPTLVADALREAILRGELSGGQPLRQDELAQQFELSPTPIREALRQLEVEGLVVYTPNRGAVVSQLSVQEIAEVYDIRVVLEAAALRWAFPYLTTSDIDRAEQVIHITDQADAGQWAMLNWQFHEIMYSPCQKPRLLGFIRGLHNTTDRYSRLSLSLGRFQQGSQQGHRQITAAVAGGDVDFAVQKLVEHIIEAQKIVVDYLKAHMVLNQ